MHPDQNLYAYLHQLQSLLGNQERRISHLEATLDDLNQTIGKMENDKQPVTVNYSFDQLKVDTLEGTLNIGLNPDKDLDDLDDFTINDQTIQSPLPSQQSDDYGDLMQEISASLQPYLGGRAYQDLTAIEENKNYPLDDAYRQFIISDIQKQLQPRIDYYIKKYKDQYHQRDELVQAVTLQVQNDIKKAFEMFIDYLPKKRREKHEF
ncbi:spore germination protein PC [Scopulibacillus darangshiensis]|uniref:Spore germination protein PC n=1 Tax=Scopulibacillus darangshiensis TaxID=442528 RepID=A0A4R2P9I7_9BACL|nr:spore germination protein GerPC [Scopulibacillus darangshiensis]TCP31592.1 spore germination protein PC [Scopulibacillus darangshiensis]